jgi:hypothetical protein
MAYKSENLKLDNTGKTLGASETNTVVSESFRINDCRMLVVDFYVSAVTDGGSDSSVTATVQSTSGGGNWVASKASAAITSTGWKSITLLETVAGDQTYLPLRPIIRLVATTAAGDSLTITDVIVSN